MSTGAGNSLSGSLTGSSVLPARLRSRPQNNHIISSLVMWFCLCVSSFSVSAAPAIGERLTSQAVLTYNNSTRSVLANLDVTFGTTVGNQNRRPTDILLNCTVEPECEGGLIIENEVGPVLGDLAVLDPDSGDSHSLGILNDDELRFEIVDGQLKLVDGIFIDFETESTINLTIRAIDSGGLIFDRDITIQVRDVNESPFDLQSSNSFVVAGSDERRIGTLTASDVDAEEVQVFSVLGDDRFTVLDGNILGLADGVALDPDTTIPVTVIVTDKGGLTTRTLVNVTTNPPTPGPGGGAPTIEFVAPNDSGESVDVPEASCSPPSGFLPDVGPQTSLRTSFLPSDVSGPKELDTVDAYAIGDPVIVSVEDQQDNLHPFELDRIEVRLDIEATGDSELLTLVETDIASGVFVGFVFTTPQQSTTNDCILTVASRTQVDAVYTKLDGLQTVTSLAQISPVGILFNDATGEAISGVILALIDDVTGEPADVRGDGPEFALFPSTVRTGETVTDAAGNTYENGPGEYRFPAVPEGRYRIVIFNDDGWNFSDKPDSDIQALGGQTSLDKTSDGRFFLTEASRGDPFEIGQGTVPRTDIPVVQAEPPAIVEPSPSQIEFFQYSANPNFGTPVDVGQTTCVAGVESQVSELKGASVPVPGIVNLAPATVFKVGQPIFVQATDLDQNFDSQVREQITIELSVPASSDREFVRLMETGPDTGTFAGYIQSTGDSETTTSNCELSVVKDEMIWTGYSDIFDDTDVSEALVLVDPFGQIFSTKDGRLIDGVTVTLIDTSTGAPADVFGDGPAFAPYPSTVISGGETADEAGVLYDFPEGEYRFPFVEPGFYQLRFENIPSGLIFPSTASNEEIQSLTGAPFEIVVGSRGEEFEVPVGPALNIDIPLDEPLGNIFVSKQASRELVAIGDFVQYRVNVTNNIDASVGGSRLIDTMPAGFRYQSGSLKANGVQLPDPVIGSNGRVMTIDLPIVDAAGIDVTYVVEITPGAQLGLNENTATVVGNLVEDSNTASARIVVKNDLFNNKAFLVGRVFQDDCKAESKELIQEESTQNESTQEDPKIQPEGEGSKGLAGIKIYLEDGSFVITDKDGYWHMEGIDPGSHVVQLDVDSLPQRYELKACKTNNRFAGVESSQFVDVQGGTLWRADFRVQDKPLPESVVTMEQTLKLDEEGVWVSVDVSADGLVDVDGVKAIYRVPKGWQIVPGTAVIDGLDVAANKTIVGTVFKFGSLVDSKQLRFKIEPKAPPAKAVEVAEPGELQVLQPRFETRSVRLTKEDHQELDEMIRLWSEREWNTITVVGHTDDVPISPRNRHEFSDNKALSLARANSVADYIRGKVPAEKILVVGAGESFPIADNRTSTGRSENRRVEFLLQPKPILTVAKQVVSAELLNGESSVRLGFQSVATPKGRTDTNKLPLNRLVGGFDKLSAVVEGKAIGSWDLVGLVATEREFRDPDVQGLISLRDGSRLGRKVTAVKLDLDSRLKPRLTIDGVEVPRDRIGFSLADEKTGKSIYSYIAVDFGEPGPKVIKLEGIGPFGNARFEEEISIVRVGKLHDFRLVSAEGNVADGYTPVRLKLSLTDKVGEPLNIPQRLNLKGGDLKRFNRGLSLTDLADLDGRNTVEVSADGTLKLDPVSTSGLKRVTLSFEDLEREFEVFVQPEERDWIMVGIAEGTTAYRSLSGNMQSAEAAGLSDGVESDGRIAFYAKGQVKGDFILTIAYDTDKEREDSLTQVIDPNTYYTLYGDASRTQYDAASQEKLYLKLEKEQFVALFGDYNTNLTGGELTNYSRALSGFKTEYESDKFDVVVFASETDQAFIKDEIRGDGTSGLYRLSTKGIVVNSEQIKLESRDRFHSEQILEERSMTRHVDYNIDYERGTIFFKEPIFSQDTAFNPVFIVIDYEVDGEGADELNVGGRVAYKPQEGMEVGLTLVKEGVRGQTGELAGLDFNYEVNDSTEVRAEIATTKNDIAGNTIEGTAYLIEAEHRGTDVVGRAYIREQEGNFGLGQQNDSETSTRKIGVEGVYQVTDGFEVSAEAYRQTNLADGVNQDVVSTSAQYQGDKYLVSSGLRSARSESASGEQMSNQLLLGGQYRVNEKLAVRANAEAAVLGKGDVGDFPKRLRVGLDYKLNEKITLKAEQEFTWGDAEDTQGTRVGMSSSLWEGGELVTNFEQSVDENNQRLAAVAGLKQRWDLNDQWGFDFGVDRSQTIKDKTLAAAPDLQVTTVFSSPSSSDFTSVTFGSKFQKDAWDWSTRVEYRDADDEDRINFVSDVIHNLDEGKQLLAKFDLQSSDSDASDNFRAGIQLGYSYRPADSRWTLFNRLDLSHDDSVSSGFDQRSRRIVNNLNANYLWNDATQVAFQYSMKYVIDNYDDDEYRGFTDLYGLEVRHDLGNKWDLGIQGSMYNSHNSDLSDYSYGMSVGYNMARNVWVSLGYNFSGFQDDDFTASEYTSEGLFLKYRLKFDQNTASSILGLMDR